MTLAFSYDFGAGPWLVADTMVSGSIEPSATIPLPCGRADVVSDSINFKSFASKIAQYDNFTIAWAGKADIACATLCHIERHRRDSWWTPEYLHQMLRNAVANDDVSFLLHEIAPASNSPFPKIRRTAFGNHTSNGTQDDSILAIGSGRDSICDLLHESPRAPYRHNVRRSPLLGKVRVAHVDYIETLAKLTSSEADWWLEHGCGGMYEACIPVIGDPINGKFGYQRFVKLERIDLLYWDVHHPSAEALQSHPNLGEKDVCMPNMPTRSCAISYMDGVGIVEQRDLGPFLKPYVTVVILLPPQIESVTTIDNAALLKHIHNQNRLSGTSACVAYGHPLKSTAVVLAASTATFCSVDIAPPIQLGIRINRAVGESDNALIIEVEHRLLKDLAKAIGKACRASVAIFSEFDESTSH